MITLLSKKMSTGALLCAVLMASAFPAVAADPQARIKVGQYQVDMVTMGSGPYTVIFESGFASNLSVWQNVAPEIAKSAKVVVYSRAGLGKSDPRPEPRTPQRSSMELEEMIDAAHLKAPFILVGHSYGGYLIRLFAARHPEQVAGMVFVDPSVERFDTELKKIDAARVAQDQLRFQNLVPPAFKDEFKLVDEAFAAASLLPAPALPDVPAVVLTSTMPRPKPEFFSETEKGVTLWRTLHEQLFRQFSSGSHIVTASSGHNIHREEPGLVTGAIQQVMASATVLAKRRAHEQARASLSLSFDKAAALLKAQRKTEAAQLIAADLKASQFGEKDINAMGYAALGERKQPEIAALVMQYNADTFPASANARDSYGEVLMAVNQPKLAKAQFEQAIALGIANGASPGALDGLRKNLALAEKALAGSQ